jgi:DNA-binding NtrC family response regulator
MHANELDHKGLLELDGEAGVIRFAGQRAVLLDAMAMGLLRKYLVENFGAAAARSVLTQFGFAHGWRMAEAMRAEFDWDSEADWRLAPARIFALGGLFQVKPENLDPTTTEGLLLDASYEAEQHLLHFGKAATPVCWTICGLLSGYLSRVGGRKVYVLEDRCLGKGDAACHLFGRSRQDWGDEHTEEFGFFDAKRLVDYLDVSILEVTQSLRRSERKLREHRRALHHSLPQAGGAVESTVKSDGMRKLLDAAHRIAKFDSTVLITGESGTGKERIARLIHRASARSSGPFIAVNCGAVTETLLESELFGHAKGAFTDACHDRQGLFEAADKGILFLDEISEISPAMQVKLLRALQEREVRRVGENKSRPVDVRVLAATNRDLALGIQAGAFRQDLYYRLRVIELQVPPLRERREDILPLARELLADAALKMKRRILGLSPRAADQLLHYEWPGNVRELENAMERAIALAQGNRVELDDLPEEIREAALGHVAINGAVWPLETVERNYILAALELNHGNQTHTARQLKIGAATLYRKLKSYGMIAGENQLRNGSGNPR